jgi:integrase/recombinase XerC
VRTRESYAQDLAPLLACVGAQPVTTALTSLTVSAFLATQERLSAGTYNRRFAALRSLVRWCQKQGYLDTDTDPLACLERRPQTRGDPRALDPDQVEAVLRSIHDVRDRALFWLIYDGGLRCHEALAIDLDDIDWTERCIRIHGKGGAVRDMFFSRRVAGYLDAYIKVRGEPAHGPLFVTARRARNPRRADLTAEGYARLSYRQADTLWKQYTPGWDLHQLRHTAISARAAKGYTEAELKRFSGHASLRSLEVYIAHNREAAKHKARVGASHQRGWVSTRQGTGYSEKETQAMTNAGRL